MSTAIDYATNRHPVFGEDITMTVGVTDYSDKLIVISHSYSNTPEVVTVRNGSGDTVSRVQYDIGQTKTLSLTVVSVGANSGGAATNNADLTIGATVVLASTKHPYVVGNWVIQSTEQSADNTSLATWTINLAPKL